MPKYDRFCAEDSACYSIKLAITVIPSEAERNRGTPRQYVQVLQRGVSTWLDMTENIKSKTAAVIPAYQDEKHIGDIARRTRERLDRVLVVDDGSTDETEQRAREAGAEVIVHTQNQGKGEAIKTGLAHWLGTSNPSSSGQDRQITWVILLDSDGQHLPEEIDRFLLAAASVTRPMFFIGNRMDDVGRMPRVGG